MGIGSGHVALWQPLRTSTPPSGGSTQGALPNSITGLSGWWDASDASSAMGPTGTPVSGWNSATASLMDKSGQTVAMTPYSFGAPAGLPTTTPRLSGLLGGLGRVAGGAGTYAPALDPDLGFQGGNVSMQPGVAWTRYLVWSRPNWRQNSGRDASPITLIAGGGVPVLQADSASGQNRLL